jgi:hypothetical protein
LKITTTININTNKPKENYTPTLDDDTQDDDFEKIFEEELKNEDRNNKLQKD